MTVPWAWRWRRYKPPTPPLKARVFKAVDAVARRYGVACLLDSEQGREDLWNAAMDVLRKGE